MLPCSLAVGPRVLHAHSYRVGHITAAESTAITSYIGDDHCTVAEPKPGAVVLADPQPLHEAEGCAKPCDRLAGRLDRQEQG